MSNFTEAGGTALVSCFEQALAGFGWRKGDNLEVKYRWAGGRADAYGPLAEELLRLDLDLIAANSTPATQALKHATAKAQSVVPIVFMSVSDPVASGLVESLARPGGSFTGVSNVFPATAAKMLEHLRLVVPSMARADVIRDSANAGKTLDVAELRTGAQAMGVIVVDRGVRDSNEIDRAFADMRERRPDVLIVLVDGVTLSNRDRIVARAAADRLVTMYQVRDFVEADGLMSFCRHFAQAASHASKILLGAKPHELPVELPTGFELVVNARTARALGIVIPTTFLARADEVIE